MASQPLQNPPPGFDKLSRDEQIEYVQELWNRIAADEADVPVPEWHLQILQERLDTTTATLPWDDVKARLKNRSRG